MGRAITVLLGLSVACGDDGAAEDSAETTVTSSATVTTASATASASSPGSSETTGSGSTSTGSETTTSTGTTGESGGLAMCQGGIDRAYPDAAWDARTPDEVGLDAAGLDAFVAATGTNRGVVVRCGYLVRSWGDPASKFEWASASKPVWSTFLMFAVNEGKLDTVDDLIAEHGWALSAADQSMSFRDLANQMSGYGLPEGPGQAWAYNDYAIKLYAVTLFERVFTDGTADDVAADPARLGMLAFEDGDLFALQNGAPRVTTTPRDFARVGWLWANRGHWNGQQLLPTSMFDTYMQPGVAGDVPRTVGGSVDDYLGLGSAGGGADQTALGPGIYGFNWWFNPGGQTWPDAPDDTVQANGHWNGEVLTIIPSLGLVAAWKGSGTDPDAFDGPMNDMLRELVGAVVE